MSLLSSMTDIAMNALGQKSPLAAQAVQTLLQQNGGVDGLVKNFQEKGLGDIAKSWVSAGANLPISAAQIQTVLGTETVKNLAAKMGTTPENISEQLTQHLPSLIDQLTPNGVSPTGNDLESLAKNVLGQFLKN